MMSCSRSATGPLTQELKCPECQEAAPAHSSHAAFSALLGHAAGGSHVSPAARWAGRLFRLHALDRCGCVPFRRVQATSQTTKVAWLRWREIRILGPPPNRE